MARTRRTGNQVIEDAFYDLDVVAQEDLLRTLETIHRLKKRQPSVRKKEPESSSVQLRLAPAEEKPAGSS